jgi:hypothetical protein
LLVALVLLGGVLIALLKAGPPVAGPLDPNDTGPEGTRALAALLTHRGQTVIRTTTVPETTEQALGPGTTLVITSPGLLGRRQLAALARTRASLMIVAPGKAAAAILAPGVTVGGQAPVFSTPPRCTLPGAVLAGSAYMGGQALRPTVPGAWRCYPIHPLPGAHGSRAAGPGSQAAATSRARPASPAAAAGGGYTSLVRYSAGGRTITMLGTGTPLINQYLADDGNAALALNLLGTGPRVVWLVPRPAAAAAAAGSRSLRSLLPRPVYLVTAELGIALLLAAAWRMRRFGPLVAEPLPVIVRASETVEGHGRLYRARRARGRAAAALRAATLARITTRLGLPRSAAPEAVRAELAARTGRPPDRIQAILFGAAPRDDAALVSLASDLDALEGQVLNP